MAQEGGTISKLERALEANQRLQARLKGILEAVDGAIWSNAEMQARLAFNTRLHPRAGRYRGMRGKGCTCASMLACTFWLEHFMASQTS